MRNEAKVGGAVRKQWDTGRKPLLINLVNFKLNCTILLDLGHCYLPILHTVHYRIVLSHFLLLLIYKYTTALK